jgi:hypothetical protein
MCPTSIRAISEINQPETDRREGLRDTVANMAEINQAGYPVDLRPVSFFAKSKMCHKNGLAQT